MINNGFSSNEEAQLLDFCRHRAHLMTGARDGGGF